MKHPLYPPDSTSSGAAGKLKALEKSRISNGFEKSPRSRLANPENTAIAGAVGSVLLYAAVTRDEA
jgi:hypothetical protein